MKVKSCLSWFGSDAGVAAELAELLSPCQHVAIGFVGGASIIPHLKARSIVCNDTHVNALNFYRVMSGVYGELAKGSLIERAKHTLSHPAELREAREYLELPIPENAVRRAWAYWAVCWLSRKGAGGTTHLHQKRTSTRWTANGGSNASRIRSAADSLSAWAEHFEWCEWTELDFREFANKVADKPRTGSYWDPPWIETGLKYEQSFDEQDHRDLARVLARFETNRVVIRYGDNPLVRELYQGDRWHFTSAESRTQANQQVQEVWITNFKPKKGA